MTEKLYTGQHLNVSFDADVCIHAGECVRNVPKVFDTQRRPWILPDGDSADAVRGAVARCPSGALKVVEQPAAAPPPPPLASTESRPPLDIIVRDGGPFSVMGPVRVLSADGTVLREAPKVSLCRCGKSAGQPFCDGSHKNRP